MASVNGEEPVEMEEFPPGNDGSSVVSRQTSIATFTSHSSRRPRAPSRQKSVKEISRSMKRSVADFFGVGEENPEEQQKWFNRSVKLASRNSLGGKVKPELQRAATEESVFEAASSGIGSTSNWNSRPVPTPYDPLAVHRFGRQDSRLSRGSFYRQYSRQISTASTSRRSLRYQPSMRRRKDSVLKMAYDGLKDAVVSNNNQQQPPTVRRRKSRRKPNTYSRSFTPTSMSSFMDDDMQKSPTIDSVFNSEEILHDDVFFDTPTPSSPLVGPMFHLPINGSGPQLSGPQLTGGLTPHTDLGSTFPYRTSLHVAVPSNDFDLLKNGDYGRPGSSELPMRSPSGCPRSPSPRHYPPPLLMPQVSYLSDQLDLPEPAVLKPTKNGWLINHQQLPSPGITETPPTPEPSIPDTPPPLPPRTYRIAKPVIDNTQYNANRRQIGKGIVGRFFKHSYRTDRMNSEIKAQIDEFDDHRPFFTYWVTFVQILIYLIAVAVYGIAPPGFEETEITGEVMTPRLAVERVAYFEKDNFWIGPRQADLIHLGAKYSPCMRSDANVVEAVNKDMEKERQTACCVRNDGSGCVQSSQVQCSGTLSTFFNWSDASPGPVSGSTGKGRTSGSVCGQDPRFCLNPLSTGAYAWPDDITKWPICRGSRGPASKTDKHQHMTCEVTGRPCCIGIQGECIITTREHCFFRRGYFHEEASLCSQVNCMNEICGMIPFFEPEAPNQVYRLWTSLFLHAGLLQLLISVLFQFFIMRDLEKLAGWLRISIIYLGSGIAGSLSSAIFLPYHVEAGPAGSQFGILACLFVEVIHNWYILQNPWWSIIKLATILLFLFIIGLLPMVDNYAHLVGFIFGFLLAFAFFPHISFGKYDRRHKLIGIMFCLLVAVGLLAFLFVLFYVMPIYKCPYCHYFNCIPFTSKFCKSMEVKIRRVES